MWRALELARRGAGAVSPNPMVGCVIVRDGQIVGEGWHRRYGEAHAEVNAVRSMADSSTLADCEVYVTLEPCSHFGKTPPCADMLVRLGAQKVIVACEDPHPLVAGRGLARLRQSGAHVHTGLLRGEGEWLCRRFLTQVRLQRPYLILKWAQTADGYMAPEDHSRRWISGPEAKTLVHRWRAEEDAVLTGTQTVLSDDPQLNVRYWHGTPPLRVVLDRHGRIGTAHHVFDGTQPTRLYSLSPGPASPAFTRICLPEEAFLEQVIADLHQTKVQSVLVEAGPRLLHAFLAAGLWDEIRQFTSPVHWGAGQAAPKHDGIWVHSQPVGQDQLDIWVRPGAYRPGEVWMW